MPPLRRLALLDAPLRSSLLTLGAEAAAGSLRGFAVSGAAVAGVEATDAGEVSLPPAGTEDYVSGPQVPKNEERVRDSLRAISAEVARLVGTGSVPVLFGGDATVLLALLAGVSDGRPDQGRRGLLALDGKARFRGATAGSAADLSQNVMSLATGRGPPSMTHLARDRYPLVQEPDIVLAGVREATPEEAAALVQTRMTILPPEDLAGSGGVARFMGALGRLVRTTAEVVLHLDASALDPAQFPAAVGDAAPGGISPETIKRLLGELTTWNSEGTLRLVGMSVTGVDARKDPGGVRMHELASLAIRVFRSTGPPPG